MRADHSELEVKKLLSEKDWTRPFGDTIARMETYLCEHVGDVDLLVRYLRGGLRYDHPRIQRFAHRSLFGW